MKILIQHKATGRFLAEDGVWTDDEGEAKDFLNANKASLHCRERGLRDVQITLKFETGLPDINMAVQ